LLKSVLSKVVLGAVSVSALGALAFGGVASAQGVSSGAGGSGAVNPSNPYNAGVTATWNSTTVNNNGGWNQIENATITTTGGYGWHQTYNLTEKQKTAGGPVTVSGTVTLVTEYGSYSEALLPVPNQPSFDIPFSNNTDGSVHTQNTSPVGAALLNTEIDIVYAYHPGVNADYFFGY
jgi:hypothetical protein